jgi:drug/metabolite transporter, DME family
VLAVVHTALAFGLYTAGLKCLDAGQAAIVATVEPVVAGAVGVILLGEALTAPKVFGALLVLAGAALAQARLEKTPRSADVSLESPSRLR